MSFHSPFSNRSAQSRSRRRALFGITTAVALLGSLLTASPAFATGVQQVNKVPTRVFSSDTILHFNPQNQSLGYITTHTNFSAYDGVQANGQPLCQLVGQISWTVMTPTDYNGTPIVVNGPEIGQLIKNELTGHAGIGQVFASTYGFSLFFPSGSTWNEDDGNATLATKTVLGYNCSQTINTPVGSSGSLWPSVKTGVFGALAGTVGFISLALVFAASTAYLAPSLALNGYFTSGLVGIASTISGIGSTMITSHGDLSASLAAGVVGGCITAVTEVPYLNYWEKIKKYAEFVLAHRAGLQNVALSAAVVGLEDPQLGGGVLAEAVQNQYQQYSPIEYMLAFGTYGDLYGYADQVAWDMVADLDLGCV